MWLIHLRDLFARCSLCEKVLFEFRDLALAWLSDFSQWSRSSQEYQTMKTTNNISTYAYAKLVCCLAFGRMGVLMCVCVCVYRQQWICWVLRVGCGPPSFRGCFHGDRCWVISMTMDGSRCWPKVVDQGQGKSDCSHPDRKSKRNTPRRWVGGAEEKGAISQAKLLLGWRREKYHSNNGAKDDRRNGEGGGVGGREKEGGPKQSSIIKVFKRVCLAKQIERHPITWAPQKLPISERNFQKYLSEFGSEFICGLSSLVYFWDWCRLWLENIDWIVQRFPLQPYWFLFSFLPLCSSSALWRFHNISMWSNSISVNC